MCRASIYSIVDLPPPSARRVPRPSRGDGWNTLADIEEFILRGRGRTGGHGPRAGRRAPPWAQAGPEFAAPDRLAGWVNAGAAVVVRRAPWHRPAAPSNTDRPCGLFRSRIHLEPQPDPRHPLAGSEQQLAGRRLRRRRHDEPSCIGRPSTPSARSACSVSRNSMPMSMWISTRFGSAKWRKPSAARHGSAMKGYRARAAAMTADAEQRSNSGGSCAASPWTTADRRSLARVRVDAELGNLARHPRQRVEVALPAAGEAVRA